MALWFYRLVASELVAYACAVKVSQDDMPHLASARYVRMIGRFLCRDVSKLRMRIGLLGPLIEQQVECNEMCRAG